MLTRILTVLSMVVVCSALPQQADAQYSLSELESLSWTFSDAISAYGPSCPTANWPTRRVIGDMLDYVCGMPPVAPVHPLIHPIYGPFLGYLLKSRTDVALERLLVSPVTQGVRLTKLYSSSWIIETPGATIAVDYNDAVFDMNPWGGVDPSQRMALASEIDAYFITHIHPDHLSLDLVVEMAAQGKPVFVPQQMFDEARNSNDPHAAMYTVAVPDVTHQIGDINWTHFAGHQFETFQDPQHLVPTPGGLHVGNSCYLFDANGVGICHYGDNNDVGAVNWTQLKLEAGWAVDIALNVGIWWREELLDVMQPQLAMHSHELEFTHLLNFIYLDVGAAPNPNRRVLFWGESFDFAP